MNNEFNTINDIITIFDNFYQTFKTEYQENSVNETKRYYGNFPKRLTMLLTKNCDYCQNNNCINKNNGSNTINLMYLYGIQLCDNCLSKHSESYFKYIMEIRSKCICVDHFKNIVQLVKQSQTTESKIIDFNDIWVSRTNGTKEQWQIDPYNMIYYNIDKTSEIVNVPVISKDHTISKTNNLRTFCKLNEVDYNKCIDLIKTLYDKNEK